jgi:sugar transferase (PEP-CTERM/EpsH1 system associated)
VSNRAPLISTELAVPDGSAHSQRHVLILANRLPFPLDDGWKVRTFHVIRGVAAHARVSLAVFHPPEDRESIAAARRELGADVRIVTVPPPKQFTVLNLMRGLLTRFPVQIWNQESAALRRELRRIAAEDPVDMVLSESIFLMRYLDLVPRSVPRIIDTHNIDSVTYARYERTLPRGPRRWYTAATVRRVAALEAALFRTVDMVWVCSDVEREMAEGLARTTPVRTIPNGVATDAFTPAPFASAVPARLLFFGRLDYYPNQDGLAFFIREILPRVKRIRPDVELHVVGAGAHRDVADPAGSPHIRLVGRVDDLRAALAGAAVVVVPLRAGGGTRLKILEALAMARPVVTTSIGAEGLPVEHDVHLLVADAAEEFAAAILSLLDDAQLAERLGKAGRQLVCERFDWTRIHRLVAHSMDELLGAAR